MVSKWPNEYYCDYPPDYLVVQKGKKGHGLQYIDFQKFLIKIEETGGGSVEKFKVYQPDHGFTIGQVGYVVRYDMVNGYVLANADNEEDAEVIGIVTEVLDSDNFYLLLQGRIQGITLYSLIPGTVYYLSDISSGMLTETEPTEVGHISKPLLIADSTSSGMFFNFRGYLIPEPVNTNGTTVEITQSNHGFIFGDILRHNGSIYVKSKADSEDNAEVVGVVIEIKSVNVFVLLTEGYVSGFSGLIAGEIYYLSDINDGELTLTEPTLENHVSKPLFFAVSSSEGFFHNYRGNVIAPTILQSGTENLCIGDESVHVNFYSSFSGTDYSITISLSNSVDNYPSQYTYIVKNKLSSGFDVVFSSKMDSDNYKLEWFAIYNSNI